MFILCLKNLTRDPVSLTFDLLVVAPAFETNIGVGLVLAWARFAGTDARVSMAEKTKTTKKQKQTSMANHMY